MLKEDTIKKLIVLPPKKDKDHSPVIIKLRSGDSFITNSKFMNHSAGINLPENVETPTTITKYAGKGISIEYTVLNKGDKYSNGSEVKENNTLSVDDITLLSDFASRAYEVRHLVSQGISHKDINASSGINTSSLPPVDDDDDDE